MFKNELEKESRNRGKPQKSTLEHPMKQNRKRDKSKRKLDTGKPENFQQER